MTTERLAELIKLRDEGKLGEEQVELLDTVLSLRDSIFRFIDRHPIYVRDWDKEGLTITRPCACRYCICLRESSVGQTE